MTPLALLTSLDEKMAALLPLITQTLEKLLRLQLDEKTDPKTLQIHTRAVAVQNASLRSLTQLRKQLIASHAASREVPAAPPPAVTQNHPRSPAPSSVQHSEFSIQDSLTTFPTPTPQPRSLASKSSLPSSPVSQLSEFSIQNSPPSSPAPQSPPPASRANPRLPSFDPLTPISGALLKNDPIFSNPSASVSGKILPPPRPPLNWFHNQPRCPAKKPR